MRKDVVTSDERTCCPRSAVKSISPPASAMEVGLPRARGDLFENPGQVFELVLLLEIANRLDGASRLGRTGAGEVPHRKGIKILRNNLTEVCGSLPSLVGSVIARIGS
jgi:hypothetical protein